MLAETRFHCRLTSFVPWKIGLHDCSLMIGSKTLTDAGWRVEATSKYVLRVKCRRRIYWIIHVVKMVKMII